MDTPFASTGHGGFGDNDLFVSRRHDADDDFGWETPTNLGGGVNTAFNDQTPGFFEDESGTGILYFSSNRPGGLGGFDVYASIRDVDDTFRQADLEPQLSSSANDTFPMPRRDGLELFLTSNRVGTLGVNDLWVSTRASTWDPWGVPINMGAPINTTAGENRGAIAFDRTTMIFYSNRPGGFGDSDLYLVTRNKVTGKP